MFKTLLSERLRNRYPPIPHTHKHSPRLRVGKFLKYSKGTVETFKDFKKIYMEFQHDNVPHLNPNGDVKVFKYFQKISTQNISQFMLFINPTQTRCFDCSDGGPHRILRSTSDSSDSNRDSADYGSPYRFLHNIFALARGTSGFLKPIAWPRAIGPPAPPPAGRRGRGSATRQRDAAARRGSATRLRDVAVSNDIRRDINLKQYDCYRSIEILIWFIRSTVMRLLVDHARW